MTPGLFDLPAPLLQWVDERLSRFVPAPVIIAFWALVGAVLCLELYRLLSPQRKISRIKREASAAQRRLAGFDGEFADAWPLIKNLLGLSFKRVGIVLPATLAGAYPVLALLVWMSNSYGHQFPAPDATVAVDIAAPLKARWVDSDDLAVPHVQALRPDGRLALEIPVTAAVPVIHKRVWWNWLIANPAGYLPPGAPVEQIRIHLPNRELFAAGPSWLRGWEVVFIPVLFIAALAYRSARHIV